MKKFLAVLLSAMMLFLSLWALMPLDGEWVAAGCRDAVSGGQQGRRTARSPAMPGA